MRTQITWDNLEVGDYIISAQETKYIIIERINSVVFFKEEGIYGTYYNNIPDMVKHDWKIVQPEPIDEDAPFEPKDGQTYYLPIPIAKSKYSKTYYNGCESDIYCKEYGFCFRTPQGAVKAAEKMLNALK